eukprot:7379794-Prymnesium_polylepis.2
MADVAVGTAGALQLQVGADGRGGGEGARRGCVLLFNRSLPRWTSCGAPPLRFKAICARSDLPARRWGKPIVAAPMGPCLDTCAPAPIWKMLSWLCACPDLGSMPEVAAKLDEGKGQWPGVADFTAESSASPVA